MPEIVNAVYEGDGLVRLEQEPADIKPQERLMLFIMPAPANKTFSVQQTDISVLRQQLQDFERRYALESSDFYARFQRGEMGDHRDFIVWAGLQELLQQMTAKNTTL